MLETRLVIAPTDQALGSTAHQHDYDARWNGFPQSFR